MPLTSDERSELIQLARGAVEARVRGLELPSCDNPSGALVEKRGCFVTITNEGRLRGCIGTFQPQAPLYQTIVDMGAAAAQDPRFVLMPITPPELDQLEVEVSVLSPLEETDDPENLEVGTHGIYVVQGPHSGCFLPEVATDQGWNAKQFLQYCCSEKAGLSPDAWKEPNTKVYLFTSEKFSA